MRSPPEVKPRRTICETEGAYTPLRFTDYVYGPMLPPAFRSHSQNNGTGIRQWFAADCTPGFIVPVGFSLPCFLSLVGFLPFHNKTYYTKSGGEKKPPSPVLASFRDYRPSSFSISFGSEITVVSFSIGNSSWPPYTTNFLVAPMSSDA